MRRQLEVVVLTNAGTVVRGYGAREVITEHVGRPPVWAALSRGWCIQTWRAADLVAAAERSGFDVAFSDEREQAPASVHRPDLGLTAQTRRKARLWATLNAAPPVEQSDPGRGRW